MAQIRNIEGIIRDAIKDSKRYLYMGNLHRARREIRAAKYLLRDRRTEPLELLGVVQHRDAAIDHEAGDEKAAWSKYEQAIRQLRQEDNPMGLVIGLRDYAMYELDSMDRPEVAREYINEALEIVDTIKPIGEIDEDRIQKEKIVTEAFAAVLDLSIKERHDDAIETLRQAATELKGYEKPIYELTILASLIDALEFGVERELSTLRAIVLCQKLKNYKRAAEFTALLGGKPLRGIYRSSVGRFLF